MPYNRESIHWTDHDSDIKYDEDDSSTGMFTRYRTTGIQDFEIEPIEYKEELAKLRECKP